jgi:hypothetical protein
VKTETVEQPNYTSDEQQAFMTMLHELEVQFGYNRSRVARECNFSPAIITAVGKGERKPRYALEKMKQLYQQLTGKPGDLPAGSSPKRDLTYEMLSELRHRDKAAYANVESMIKLLYKRIRGRHRHIPIPEEAPFEGTRSNVDRVAEAGARKAVAGIRGQVRAGGRKGR